MPKIQGEIKRECPVDQRLREKKGESYRFNDTLRMPSGFHQSSSRHHSRQNPGHHGLQAGREVGRQEGRKCSHGRDRMHGRGRQIEISRSSHYRAVGYLQSRSR